MSAPLLKVNGFDLYSPAKIFLQKLSFELYSGEIMFFQGPNGTGKSTFLRELFRILSLNRPSSAIQTCGIESFVFLPQSLNREFFIPLSLGEVAGLSGSSKEEQVFGSLLPEAMFGRMWNVASGGEKQRAVLAQSLSTRRSLYLLDEPFNHLDQDSVSGLAKRMASMGSEGASFLVATHTVPEGLRSSKTLHFQPEKDGSCR
jgi:ABC-type Mn2+/Zn2+ transport system ATPase subunit